WFELFASDDERHALLLERCVPGTPLKEVDLDAALDVLVELLPRLWKPAGPPFGSLSVEAPRWADELPREWERTSRPSRRRLLEAAIEALLALATTQGELVLTNEDLHADNVLRAQREPWLMIDPKPIAGEREFGVAAIVRGAELGHGRAQVLRRL